MSKSSNKLHKNFLIVIGLVVIGAAILVGTRVSLQSQTVSKSDAATGSLTASGKDLTYNGQTVILKGTNFDNINALKAGEGFNGSGIGSGNVNDVVFRNADYLTIAQNGANHVRFGLSFNWYTEQKAAFWTMLDQQVAYAKANGIWVTFNMFTTPGNCYEGYSNSCPFWGSANEQSQLQSFWVDVANRYKDEPAVAGFDLLNEPTPPNGCTQWFPIAQRIRDAVYAVAPNKLVFVNTCSDPGNDLRYNNPPRGANIVYEVHDYSPMDMSHDMFSPGSVYPGTANEWFGSCYVDKNVFATGQGCPQMNIRESYGYNWTVQNNVPFYVGEWGAASVLNGANKYTQDKAELYRDWGWNHARYTWRHQTIKTGGFYQWGISSSTGGVDDPGKLNALKFAWTGAVRPNFGTGTVPTLPPTGTQPTITSTSAPTRVPTSGVTSIPTTVAPTNGTTIVPLPGGGSYPRILQGSNSQLTFVETKASENGRVFIEVRPNTSLNITQVDTYVNGNWYSQDNSLSYTLGSGAGVPVNGTTELRAVAYYNNTWNFIESRLTYIPGSTSGTPVTVLPTSTTPLPTGGTNPGVVTYPRQIIGTNPEIKILETRARSGNTIYLEAVPNTSKLLTQMDWYINGRWTTYDKIAPFYLSSYYAGTNNGFTIPGPGTKIRIVAYINNTWNFIETTITYNY